MERSKLVCNELSRITNALEGILAVLESDMSPFKDPSPSSTQKQKQKQQKDTVDLYDQSSEHIGAQHGPCTMVDWSSDALTPRGSSVHASNFYIPDKSDDELLTTDDTEDSIEFNSNKNKSNKSEIRDSAQWGWPGCINEQSSHDPEKTQGESGISDANVCIFHFGICEPQIQDSEGSSQGEQNRGNKTGDKWDVDSNQSSQSSKGNDDSKREVKRPDGYETIPPGCLGHRRDKHLGQGKCRESSSPKSMVPGKSSTQVSEDRHDPRPWRRFSPHLQSKSNVDSSWNSTGKSEVRSQNNGHDINNNTGKDAIVGSPGWEWGQEWDLHDCHDHQSTDVTAQIEISKQTLDDKIMRFGGIWRELLKDWNQEKSRVSELLDAEKAMTKKLSKRIEELENELAGF